jgi:hypothetical protein
LRIIGEKEVIKRSGDGSGDIMEEEKGLFPDDSTQVFDIEKQGKVMKKIRNLFGINKREQRVLNLSSKFYYRN